jgi:hypothetical protein
MSASDDFCLTIRLSLGDRPVLLPEYATRAPVDEMQVPRSYRIASSYKAAVDKLVRTVGPMMPYWLRSSVFMCVVSVYGDTGNL